MEEKFANLGDFGKIRISLNTNGREREVVEGYDSKFNSPKSMATTTE